jgi:hypothetical protein
MAKPKKNLRASVCEAIRRLLPDPVREEGSSDSLTLTAGDPGLVVVTLDDEGVGVGIFQVRWEGPHTPVPYTRPLARVGWSDFHDQGEEAVVAVHLLVQAAAVVRRAAFRRCRYCGDNTPPEWWHGKDACQGCAERHLGVVH